MTTKSLAALVDILETAIAADSTIRAWCLANFGEALEVAVGTDPEIPPELDDTPRVNISTGGRSRTPDFLRRTHAVLVWVAFKYGRRNETDVSTRQALRLLDELCNLVDSCVIPAAARAGYVILPTEGQDDQVAYPMARGFLSYQIEVPAQLPA